MLPRRAKIKEVINENHCVRTFVLDSSIIAKPGQYVMVWLPGVDEKPISVSRPDPLTLTVANRGPFTSRLFELKVNDFMSFRGPFGNGFALRAVKNILLVGGGYGAAPLRFLAETALQKNIRPTMVIGAKTADEVLLEEAFNELKVKTVIATDDGSKGVKGTCVDAARELMEKEKFNAVFSCGPEKMMAALAQECGKHSVRCQLSLERYIKCGIGVCGQCCCDGLRVCHDGPVFDSRVLKSVEDFGRVARGPNGAAYAL
ncbi:MAG: dihydroorotate dehydrogenase electron transfer subunit [Candidatus Micrarchaeota archaeon]